MSMIQQICVSIKLSHDCMLFAEYIPLLSKFIEKYILFSMGSNHRLNSNGYSLHSITIPHITSILDLIKACGIRSLVEILKKIP